MFVCLCFSDIIMINSKLLKCIVHLLVLKEVDYEIIVFCLKLEEGCIYTYLAQDKYILFFQNKGVLIHKI